MQQNSNYRKSSGGALAATLALASLAGGVGVGVGQGLVARQNGAATSNIPGVSAVWAAQEAPNAPRSGEEQSVIRAVRKARPAVVSVGRRGGSGSGVIIRPDGVILTNAHVVGDVDTVRVELGNGETVDGRVVGRDPGVDIAVVKIAGNDLPSAPLADSDKLEVGQAAIAIGNPLGYRLARSVTTGVISGVGRVGGAGSGYSEGFIQTDAAINRGNSGGPLLDSLGRVVGINSWVIRGNGGDAQGLGFAVPINVAKNVADQLLTTGRSQRVLLGVSYTDVDPELAAAFKLAVTRGVVVEEVPSGSPADRAGLQKGDIISAVQGVPVRSGGDLRRILRSRRPGQSVTVTLQRDNETLERTVRLAAVPTRVATDDEE